MSDTDLEKYRRHVEHFDMPEGRKTELLRSVWRIMQSFVDRAFGDDPVQQVCGGSQPTIAAPEGNRTFFRAPETGTVIDLEPSKTPIDEMNLAGDFRDSAKGSGRRK